MGDQVQGPLTRDCHRQLPSPKELLRAETKNMDLLGPSRVIDYTAENFTGNGQAYDITHRIRLLRSVSLIPFIVPQHRPGWRVQ
jgi:hypothetical protein